MFFIVLKYLFWYDKLGGKMNLDNLNDKQREAVEQTEGPVLVLAGAGSGKTKVLTTRIAYLIKEKQVRPTSILAITFTNKAAKEMKDRVINMLGEDGYRIQISTFHSFGLLLLKQNYDKVGLEKNFTIADSEDSLTIIKKILKEKNLDPKIYSPRQIRNKISGAKNELLMPDDYEKYANTDFEQLVVEVYRKYQQRLKVNNSVDFDDLLILPILLFKENPLVLKRYQEQYQYLLVDEYQDTNEAQYILTKYLSALYKNICVVGDNDQSIYSFRGANYRNILNFEKDFPNCKTILLEENYRSTKNILQVANDIIKNNTLRKEKNLWTNNDLGVKIKYIRTLDEQEEAKRVLTEVKKLLENGVPRSSIAILYRTNVQSHNFEEAFLKNNIPYKVVGSFYFYKRKEIKDLLAYLKLIYNPKDDNSLLRIINVPKRKIGEKSIEQLINRASANSTSMFEALETPKELAFKQLIEKLIEKSQECTLTELVDTILEMSLMKQELESEKTIEADTKIEHLEEFKSITKHFEENSGLISLEEFLDNISLVADIEEHKDNQDVVTLMTVHSAKGLEFDYVFLVGMEEAIFPHSNSFDSKEDMEEERRLCYVAVTRAKKELWLLNTQKRMLYGQTTYNLPSRFLEEISDDCLEKEKIEEPKFFNKNDMIDENASYKLGDKIIHDTYGEGVVVECRGGILTIAFAHEVGIKKMMKGHKSIRKVD